MSKKVKKKPLLAGIGLLAVVLAGGAALAWWKYGAIKASANQPAFEPPEFVEVVRAESDTWQPRARLVGTVVAKQSVSLSNELAGVVTFVGFQSGETVPAGHVLVKFDTKTEEADLALVEAAERLASAGIEVARANVRSATAVLTLARSNYERQVTANQGGGGTPVEMDRVTAALEQATADLQRDTSELQRAQAELDQAKARVQQIRTMIAKKTLLSPFRARVGMLTIYPGQYLAEGTTIVSLTELTEDIYVDFAVPQEYATRVAPGTVVTAKSEILASESVDIKVLSMDATVNPTTRNVRVRASVANPDYRLRPGMFLDVDVPVDVKREVVTIPTTAVRRSPYGDNVYVLVPDAPPPGAGAASAAPPKAEPAASGAAGAGGPPPPPPGMRAKQRMVTLGENLGSRVIVLSGLSAGETIAASGSFKLRDGALVMEAPPSPPATQPADAPAAGGPAASAAAPAEGAQKPGDEKHTSK